MNYYKKLPQRRLLTVKSQLGLSLFELLIAMVIGLFLLIGITTSYLSSKKSSVTRTQLSILEDNGRAALEILTSTLQHTGYRSNNLVPIANPFMSDGRPSSVSCGTGFNSVLAPLEFPENVISNSSSASGDSGDSIGVFYLGDDVLNVDCNGEPLPAACRVGGNAAIQAHRIHNAFFIGSNDELQCVGSQSTGEITIAEGVENMQILYGMDIDDSKSVNRYVNSDDVGSDWGQVISIQIAILVRSMDEVKTRPESKSFTLLNTQVDTPNDRFQRAVFTTSINLRNL